MDRLIELGHLFDYSGVFLHALLLLLPRNPADHSPNHTRRPDTNHSDTHILPPSLSEQKQTCSGEHNAQRDDKHLQRHTQKYQQHAKQH